MHNIGPNEICGCGSGKKFKYCHEEMVGRKTRFDVEVHSRDLETNLTRSVRLLDAIDEIFSLRRNKGLKSLNKTIDDGKISELYVTVQKLWPRTTIVPNLLPAPGTPLRAFFMGDANPNQLLLDVHRLSLYVDEIMIVNPLRPPFTLNNDFNQAINPSRWRSDTLRVVHTLKCLEPFIRKGAVQLIPEPGTFDPALLDETVALSVARLEKYGGIDQFVDSSDFGQSSDRMHLIILEGCAPENRLAQLRLMHPDKDEATLQELLSHIENKLKGFEGQLVPEDRSNDEIQVFRSGANLDMALLICSITGAFPATNLPFRWREINLEQDRLSEQAKLWAPLTQGFAKLEYSFLNEVPTSFAWQLRADGRLESFREFLRKTWLSSSSTDRKYSDSDIRTFCDEMIHEFNKASAEWDAIKRSMLTKSLTYGSAAIVGGHFRPEIAPLAVAAAALTQGINFLGKRKSFRKTIPMSVFIDLSDQDKTRKAIKNTIF